MSKRNRSITLAVSVVAALTVSGCGIDASVEDVGELVDGDDDVNPSREETATSSDALEGSQRSCGAQLGSFEGTAAHSNGRHTGTGRSCAGTTAYGLGYQCVELVMRHFKTKWGLRWYGHAKSLLANAPRAQVDVYRNGDEAHPPRPGDMVVWENGKYGHVALVTRVTKDSVEVLEQNVAGGARASLPFANGRIGARWGSWTPSGWGHARANDPGASRAPSVCSKVPSTANGLFCGRTDHLGFDAATADDRTLYDCRDGAVATEIACPRGCIVEPPGENDRCAP